MSAKMLPDCMVERQTLEGTVLLRIRLLAGCIHSGIIYIPSYYTDGARSSHCAHANMYTYYYVVCLLYK